MSDLQKTPTLILELPDDQAARRVAEALARKTGKPVVVKDEEGNEIAVVRPPARN